MIYLSLGLWALYNTTRVCSGSLHLRYQIPGKSCPVALRRFHDKWESFTGSFRFFFSKSQYISSCQSPVNFHICAAITTTNAFNLTTSQISFRCPSRKIQRKDRNYYITEYLLLHPT